MIRARLARLIGPAVQYLDYIGALAHIPAGWTVVTRRRVRP